MAVSVVPELIDALVDQATTALPDATVFDGFGVSDDPGDYLMVGVDDHDTNSNALAADVSQEWASTSGTAYSRDESGDITCVAYSWNGDGPDGQKAARDAVYAIAEALALICRTTPALGVSNVLWTSFGTSLQLSQNQTSAGADALLVFRIHFRARI